MNMNTTNTLPKLVLTTVLLAACLGACGKKDAGIGGDGDGAAVTNRSAGEGAGGAAGVSGASSNAGDTGLAGTDYKTNNTPRTVDGNTATQENSMGAVGGASGFDGKVPVDSRGGTTGGSNPGGAPMQAAPQAGRASDDARAASTGNTTGTGPASTKTGAGEKN
jgi:hypothetical protein